MSSLIKFPDTETLIQNPANDHHVMWYSQFDAQIEIFHGDTVLLRTRKPMRITEIARIVMDPVLYLPISDMIEPLRQNQKTTHCPLKGDAVYYDLIDESGEIICADIAWAYPKPLDFAMVLEDHLAFYTNKVKVIQSG